MFQHCTQCLTVLTQEGAPGILKEILGSVRTLFTCVCILMCRFHSSCPLTKVQSLSLRKQCLPSSFTHTVIEITGPIMTSTLNPLSEKE